MIKGFETLMSFFWQIEILGFEILEFLANASLTYAVLGFDSGFRIMVSVKSPFV
jgi:hypothetical protein